jgi:regulator of replication initiation timing
MTENDFKHIDTNNANDIASLKNISNVLLNHSENLYQKINYLEEENQLLRDEINRLKNENTRPNIRANSIKKYSDISTKGREKKPKKQKRKSKKNIIKIDDEKILNIEKKYLPEDAEFKFWDEVITQNIILKRENILYKVAVFYSKSERKTYRAKLPEGRSYHSDGITNFAILLNKVCDVTSEKILMLYKNMGIEISTGSLSKILLSHTDLQKL